MQEVFEKIIEKLEERKQFHERMIAYESKNGTVTEEFQARKAVEVVENAIEIVKWKAEQFGRDTNVGSNGWIPCSERMPEDEQVVITCKYKSISILRYSTKTNHLYELNGNWWWSANMVTAWQPLPQPYQQKGE